MKQHFTNNDLIRFIYKETSASESLAITEALNEDPILFDEYEELYHTYLQLPKAKFSPAPSSLQNILRYSEQTAVETFH